MSNNNISQDRRVMYMYSVDGVDQYGQVFIGRGVEWDGSGVAKMINHLLDDCKWTNLTVHGIAHKWFVDEAGMKIETIF